MGMFDNYSLKSTDIPSNIYKYLVGPEENYIVANGSCYNTFRMMFYYDASLITSVSVTYYQAERLTLTKSGDDLEIANLDDHTFIVKCNLSPEETAMFKGTNLDTLAQVKLVYGDRVLFGAKHKIKVIETIEEN